MRIRIASNRSEINTPSSAKGMTWNEETEPVMDVNANNSDSSRNGFSTKSSTAAYG
jgi:hypothetical protein